MSSRRGERKGETALISSRLLGERTHAVGSLTQESRRISAKREEVAQKAMERVGVKTHER
jgi:hypothetical protein